MKTILIAGAAMLALAGSVQAYEIMPQTNHQGYAETWYAFGTATFDNGSGVPANCNLVFWGTQSNGLTPIGGASISDTGTGSCNGAAVDVSHASIIPTAMHSATISGVVVTWTNALGQPETCGDYADAFKVRLADGVITGNHRSDGCHATFNLTTATPDYGPDSLYVGE